MKHLRTLNHYFLKYKWHFAGGLVFVALSTIFGTFQGVVVRHGTNDILETIKTGDTSNTFTFVKYGLTIIGLALVSGLFMFLMRQTIIVMSRHIEYDQKNEIYRHYQELDQGFYKRYTTGDLMNRISEDVSRVRMYTGPAIMYLANTIVTTLTVLIFMLSVNPRLTLLVFLPLPVLSFVIYKVSDIINRQGARVQRELGDLTSQAQESFGAIRIIKAYAREPWFVGEMARKGEKYRHTALKLATTEALFMPAMSLMIGLSVLVTVWYGGHLTIDKEIAPGNITEFILYVYRLTWPFASLGWVTSLMQRAAASQERINEFLHSEPVIRNQNTGKYEITGDVEFRNVTFTFPENNVTALKNISFKIEHGTQAGITGPVGSGKSTLIALLLRLYDPTEGDVLVDGMPLRNHNLGWLRSQCGVVPQDVFLFSDTIKGNIAFGAKNGVPAQQEIDAAARKAGVYDNIMAFPEKFDTLVGERGVTLSGGQKQRISIARAIAGHPRMLLFDDCLSAVDSETEELILGNLRREMAGKTSIIVSHRVSSIRSADTIFFLKNGEITERGTHEELLALRKDYFRLFQLQNEQST